MSLDRRALLARALALAAGGSSLAAVLAPTGAAARRATAPRQRIVSVQPGAITSLEPDGPAYVNAATVLANAYDGLTDVTLPASLQAAVRQLRGKGLAPQPALATSWESDARRAVWRFQLRQGARSAAGATLTADDVAWSAGRWIGQGFIAQRLLAVAGLTAATQVAALDPATVQMTLPAPAPPWFLALFSLGFLPVYDSRLVKRHVTAADPWAQAFLRGATAGFGPYAVRSLNAAGDQALLVANAGYWRGTPAIASIVRQAVDDDAERLQLLLSRNADHVDQLTAVQYDQVARGTVGKVVSTTSTRGLFIGFDNAKPPFDDAAVRRGIALAVPYDDILTFVHRNRAQRWKSVIRLPFLGYTEEFWKYDLDAETAKTALAGVIAARTPLRLSYPVGAGAGEGAAILIQATLKSIGVNVLLEPLAPSLYNQRRVAGDLAFFTDELDAPLVWDGHFELNQHYTSKAALPHLLKFKETALIDPISAKLALVDPVANAKDATALLRQAQSILVPLMPIVPISITGSVAAVTAKLDTHLMAAHEGGALRFDELKLTG